MAVQRTFRDIIPFIIIVFSSDMGYTRRKWWPPSENLAVYRIGVRKRLSVFEGRHVRRAQDAIEFFLGLSLDVGMSCDEVEKRKCGSVRLPGFHIK